MHFIHQGYDPTKTSAAIATAPGIGGIAVIRISGAYAIDIASKIFSGPVENYKSHTAHYGYIYASDGKKIDDVLLLVMRAPRSFTGEDTVEIHCHGGHLIPKMVLQAALDAGASPAEAGEFCFKAFMNGKIDLAQAEAIQSKIAAKNELALSVAQEQMEGALSTKVRAWQKQLTHLAAIFEAWVDFPEEGLEFSSFDEVRSDLNLVMNEMRALIVGFDKTAVIRDGVAICIVGSPNVGKSSLLNALVGYDRAIVSPVAGTTRDIVEDTMRLNGLHLRFIDTAGIRDCEEFVEQEGIRRSKQALERADIVLFVLDVTSHNTIDPFFSDLPKEKTIVVWNKVDVEHDRPLTRLDFDHVVETSAKSAHGMQELKEAIDRVIWRQGEFREQEAVLSELRHKQALENAVSHCERVLAGLSGQVSCEFIAFDMRLALVSLGSIIGQDVTNEILSAVFSSFCIGK